MQRKRKKFRIMNDDSWKEKRYLSPHDDAKILTGSEYNLILGGAILWGIFVNILIERS